MRRLNQGRRRFGTQRVMKRFKGVLFLMVAVTTAACDSAQQALAHAESSRARADLEQVVTRYPGTEQADQATAYLRELDELQNALSTDEVEPFLTFLTSHPDGLFTNEAHLGLEGAAERLARGHLAQDERFQEISGSLGNLSTLISGDDERLAKLARLAREELQIAVLKVSGGAGRFVLPGIQVHSQSESFRFSVADTSVGPLHEVGGASGTLHGLAELPPAELKCHPESGAVLPPLVFYTELEGDLMPGDVGIPGAFVRQSGSSLVAGFEPIHCAAGSVWRFAGDTVQLPGIRIHGEPGDPLSFFLIKAVGPVLLAGSGWVATTTGEVLFDSAQPVSLAVGQSRTTSESGKL